MWFHEGVRAAMARGPTGSVVASSGVYRLLGVVTSTQRQYRYMSIGVLDEVPYV